MKWIAMALFVFIGAAQAQVAKLSEKQVTAWNAVQADLTACAAFWQFAKACAPEGTKEDELKRVDQIIMKFTDLALSVGTNLGMSQDAMVSRLKMALEDQAKLTDGKCINYASLMTRYLNRCKAIAENPESAFHEYMNK